MNDLEEKGNEDKTDIRDNLLLSELDYLELT